MAQKNEMSARALRMEELEMVNGGRGPRRQTEEQKKQEGLFDKGLEKICNSLGYVWWSLTH